MSSQNKNNNEDEDYEMQEVSRRWRNRAEIERTPGFYHLDYSAGPTNEHDNNLAQPNRNKRNKNQSDNQRHDRVGDQRYRDYIRHQNSLHNEGPHFSRQRANLLKGRISPSYRRERSQNTDEDNREVYDRWNCDDQSELVSRNHRITSIHRNAIVKEPFTSSTCRTFPNTLEGRRKWMSPAGHVIKQTSLEQRADNIANHMEQDETLMENTLESEQLRREALRDMPQCLTVKRIIKKKLTTSVSRHSKHKPLSLCKRFQYWFSIKKSKAQNSFKSLAYTFELWYSSLKTIEGHFGSGVATYFKFFRWLFVMNCLIMLFIIGFVVIPQLLYINISSVDARNDTNNGTSIIVSQKLTWNSFKMRRSENNESFEFSNIFTGEGYFTDTALYYGFYTNNSVNLIKNQYYIMPYAYFFTMFCMYLVSFIVLSTSMARSYRRSFIETQGGLKNVYAHKIFCGWDYSIATEDAADLKATSICNELKELLSESVKITEKKPLMQRFWTFIIQLVVNITVLIKLVGTGYIMWFLLEKNNSNSSADAMVSPTGTAVATAVIINVIMLIFPTIFGFVVRFEDYQNPRAALYITLVRTFLLKTVVVGVFLAFWLTHSENEKCWETSIGQHIYRLIVFNFILSVVLAAIIEAVRYFIYKKLWKWVGAPTFNIAKYTLQLMYNQTLFWVGLYFSPLLSVVVVVKLWFMWYIRRNCLLWFCQPSSKSWRAAQTHTWFLILSFLSLLLVFIAHGYIMVKVATSDCGPFRGYQYMYEMILLGVFQLQQNNLFWKALMYLTKPGTVALILIAMCVIVYYLRAKAIAQKEMVDILRNMLVLEAKDKEFLLKNISKVTEGQWQYNLHGRANEGRNKFENATFAELRMRRPREDYGEGDELSSDSESRQDYTRSHSSSSNLFLSDSPESQHNYVHRKKY